MSGVLGSAAGKLIVYSIYVLDAPRFVFVVGFARSGTTLLATLLDRHSCIAATPETHFFNVVIPANARLNTRYDAKKSIAHFLANERVADLSLTVDDFSVLLQQDKCTWRDIYSHALALYGERRGAKIVVEKTPGHMTKIDTILDWYPDAKIIHIVRDGRDSVLSLMRVDWAHDNLRRHSANWRWETKRMRRFREVSPNNIYELNYESLLGEPEACLRRVCEFIGVDFEASQLDATTEGNAIPAWESGWKLKAAETIDPSRIQAWRKTATDFQRYTMNSIMGPALREYGYQDSGASDYGRPALIRAKNYLLNTVFLVLQHPRVKALARVKPVSHVRRRRLARSIEQYKRR